jgi:pimeloyl-ACP methyl ester carboxylesterase
MTQFVRRQMLVLGTLLGCGLFVSPLQAQSKFTPTLRAESVSAPDAFPIRFSYYPANADKNPDGLDQAGVVILLHGDKGSRIIWDKGSAPAGQPTFPAVLQEQGYAVVTVDLRKHGQSVVEGREDPLQTDDYAKMAAGDLKAVKDFLQKEHQDKKLNMGKMAIVGAGFSAPVAVAFAEYDWLQKPHDDSPVPAMRTPRGQDVKAVILLSPDAAAGRLSTNRSLVYLTKQNLAIQLIVGKQDGADKGAAKNCFKASGGGSKRTEERVFLIEPDMKDRGTDLLGKAPPLVEVPMLKFLDARLKKLTIPWVDRRSRLDR